MTILFWELKTGVDTKSLLRWAASEFPDEIPSDVIAIINGIEDRTESIFVDESQFVPLLNIATSAEKSGTHHSIYAIKFKRDLANLLKDKPVRFDEQVESKPVEKQRSLF